MSVDWLDPIPILASLGYHDPREVSPVRGGRDTAIWRVRHGGRSYALRVFRPEQAPVVAYEVAAMRAARDGGVPVPDVHACGEWRDRPAILLSWAEGRTVFDELQRSPARAWELGVLSGQTLARVHTVPAPEHARSWRAGPGSVAARLGDRLDAVGRDDTLLHLDFHPLNLLTDGQRVTAVLDWTNARAGDPRADLARSISILRLDTAHLAPETRALARQYERGLRHGYGPVTDLAPFLAWAGAFMLDDIDHRLDKDPGGARQRDQIHRWIERWRKRSGTG